MVVLLLGDSGVGKTTIARALQRKYPYINIVHSYTTRFKRSLYDNDHIFMRKHNLLYKMFHNKVVASTIIDGELYGSFPDQFRDDMINVYTVDDKGLLDVINYYGIDNVCAVRLKRGNIMIHQQRAERNLNQIISDKCPYIHIIDNNSDVSRTCSDILLLCKQKWPVFFETL